MTMQACLSTNELLLNISAAIHRLTMLAQKPFCCSQKVASECKTCSGAAIAGAFVFWKLPVACYQHLQALQQCLTDSCAPGGLLIMPKEPLNRVQFKTLP